MNEMEYWRARAKSAEWRLVAMGLLMAGVGVVALVLAVTR